MSSRMRRLAAEIERVVCQCFGTQFHEVRRGTESGAEDMHRRRVFRRPPTKGSYHEHAKFVLITVWTYRQSGRAAAVAFAREGPAQGLVVAGRRG